MVYIAVFAYAGLNTIFCSYPTIIIAYTISVWVLGIWCGGLAVFEYKERRYEWSLFSVFNILQFILIIGGWFVVYSLIWFKENKNVNIYTLFFSCIFLSACCLTLTFIFFVDNEYKFRTITHMIFIISFGLAISSFIILWYKLLSIICICIIFITYYLILLWIQYKKNGTLHFALNISIWVILLSSISRSEERRVGKECTS